MIRILQVVAQMNRGGLETMLMNYHRHIDREQIQFDYIFRKETRSAYDDEILSLGGKIYRMPAFAGKNIIEVRKAWNKFFINHPEYRMILHSHLRSFASVYLPVAKKYGVKTIIHSHSTSNSRGVEVTVKLILQYPLRYQAGFCFECSLEAGKWLFGNKVVESTRYFTMKNAVDVEKYTPSAGVRKQYCTMFGISTDQKVYAHVGRLHKAKNHTFLLELFARMLGSRGDVAKILQASDCFLQPSKWEGLSVSVVEAQAAGLPCFVSDAVTKDVGISILVNYLPIDQGVEIWGEPLLKADVSKVDVARDIAAAGFDIRESVEWLTNFYYKILPGSK